MLKPPSCDIASQAVTHALLMQGATALEARIGAHVAGRGSTCWETDARVRLYLRRSDGRMYHRESIGRARRAMAKRGWLSSKRVMPTHVPEGAKHSSTYGTTSKSIIWKVLGIKNPLTRGQQRAAKKEQRREDRRSAAPVPRRVPVVAPIFASLVAGIGGAPTAPSVNRSTRRVERIERAERPSTVDLEAERLRQRAALAAWVEDNPEDDPPE